MHNMLRAMLLAARFGVTQSDPTHTNTRTHAHARARAKAACDTTAMLLTGRSAFPNDSVRGGL